MKLHYPPAQLDIQPVSRDGDLNDVRMIKLVRHRFILTHVPPQEAIGCPRVAYLRKLFTPSARKMIVVNGRMFKLTRPDTSQSLRLLKAAMLLSSFAGGNSCQSPTVKFGRIAFCQ
jgi:hypothetical protein